MWSSLLSVLAVPLLALSAATVPSVDPEVWQTLVTTGKTNVILHFGGPSSEQVLQATKPETSSSADKRTTRAMVLSTLRNHANKYQRATLELLGHWKRRQQGFTFEQIWLVNQITLKNVDSSILTSLLASPDIKHIQEDKTFKLLNGLIQPTGNRTESSGLETPSTAPSAQWNIEMVGAPQMWARNITGSGVAIGVMDTGCDSSHPILRSRLRPQHSWADMVHVQPEAYDDHGHGTHVAGIALGSDGYGVAPGASLVCCKSMDSTGSGPLSALLACAQFMACPDSPDCNHPVDVVNNSWGALQEIPGMHLIIQSWISLGLVPVFANGNGGRNGCDTTDCPAHYSNVVAVGAVDSSNTVSAFSGKGGKRSGQKPDVVAPGHLVKSAWTNQEFAVHSGTSMAAPHVAGIIALYMQQHHNNLSLDQIATILRSGTFNPVGIDPTCGGDVRAGFVVPNYSSGYGLALANATFDIFL